MNLLKYLKKFNYILILLNKFTSYKLQCYKEDIMEIDILEKKENNALDRTEIRFNCVYEGEATPKLLSVKSKLVALLDTKKELIVIDSIQPRFGEAKAICYAKIYGSKDSLKDIETKHVINKNQEADAPADDETVDTSAENEKIDNTPADDETSNDSAEDDKVDDTPAEEDEVENNVEEESTEEEPKEE